MALEGLLRGFTGRVRDIQAEEAKKAAEAREREMNFLTYAAQADDPAIKSAAITGLLQMGDPAMQRKRKGLAGWFGEVDTSPALPKIQELIHTPVTKSGPDPDQPTPGIAGMGQLIPGAPPPATTYSSWQQPRQMFLTPEDRAAALAAAQIRGRVKGLATGYRENFPTMPEEDVQASTQAATGGTPARDYWEYGNVVGPTGQVLMAKRNRTDGSVMLNDGSPVPTGYYWQPKTTGAGGIKGTWKQDAKTGEWHFLAQPTSMEQIGPDMTYDSGFVGRTPSPPSPWGAPFVLDINGRPMVGRPNRYDPGYTLSGGQAWTSSTPHTPDMAWATDALAIALQVEKGMLEEMGLGAVQQRAKELGARVQAGVNQFAPGYTVEDLFKIKAGLLTRDRKPVVGATVPVQPGAPPPAGATPSKGSAKGSLTGQGAPLIEPGPLMQQIDANRKKK